MVVMRPASATLSRRVEGTSTSHSHHQGGGAARARPQSAVVRHAAEVYGCTPVAELQHVNRCGVAPSPTTTSTTLSGSRPRPLSAKVTRGPYTAGNKHAPGLSAPVTAVPSAASLAMEACKKCIREIFDVCEQLHLDDTFTSALHSFLKYIAIADVATVSRILQALTDNRAATLQVLRKVEARERVLQCLEQYITEAFLEPCGFGEEATDGDHQHHHNHGGNRNGSIAPHLAQQQLQQPRLKNTFLSVVGDKVQLLLDTQLEAVEEGLIGLSKTQLTMLTSEADAIMESLTQCTESVLRELTTWCDTMTRLWRTIELPEDHPCYNEYHSEQAALFPVSVAAGNQHHHHQQQPIIGVGMYFDSPRNVHIPPPPAAVPFTTAAATAGSPERSLMSSRNNSNLVAMSASSSGHNSRGGSPTQPHASHHAPPVRQHNFLWRSFNYQQKITRDAVPFFTLQETWSLGNLARIAEVIDRMKKRERLLADNDPLRTHTEAVAAKARDEFLNIAAITIQSHFRRHQAMMWFQMYVMKRKAIATISRWWRRLKTRARFVKATDGGRAAIHLQRLWRAYVIRRDFPALIKANRAAKKIQRWWRYWDCHFRMVIRKLQRQHRIYAAVVVAKIVRRYVLHWKGRQRRFLVEAARTVQRIGRGCAARYQLRQLLDTPNFTVLVPGGVSLIQPGAGDGEEGQYEGDDHGGNLHNEHSSSRISSSSPYHSSMISSPHRSISSPMKSSVGGGKYSASTPEHPEPVMVVLRRGAPEAIRGSLESSFERRPQPVMFDHASALGLGSFLQDAARAEAKAVITTEAGTMPMTPRDSSSSSAHFHSHSEVYDSTQRMTTVDERRVVASGAEVEVVPTENVGEEHHRLLFHAAVTVVQTFILGTLACSIVADKRRSQKSHPLREVEPTTQSTSISALRVNERAADPPRSVRRPSPLHTAAARAIQQWWKLTVAPRMISRRQPTDEERMLATYTAAPQHLRTKQSPVAKIEAQPKNHPLPRQQQLDIAVAVGAPTHVGATALTSTTPRRVVQPIDTIRCSDAALHRGQGHASSASRSTMVPHRVTPQQFASNSASATLMVEAEALRKRKQAALRIAAWAARILRRRAARRKLENDSANTIARAFRTYKLQRTYFLRRRQRTLSLQRNADLARMRTYEEFKSRRRAAALQILFWYQEIKCRALLKKLDSVNHMIRSRPDRDANARRIQHFWTVARERLRFLELHKTQVEKRQRTLQQERIRRAAVKIQGQFRCYQRRNELAMRRDALHADRTLAAIVIQKHVRRWLAKNTFWQEKISKLSMFRELQRLRQKERVRISGAPIAAPKHAW